MFLIIAYAICNSCLPCDSEFIQINGCWAKSLDNDDKNDDYDVLSALNGKNVWQIIPDFVDFLKRPYVPVHIDTINIVAALQLIFLLGMTMLVTLILAVLLVEPYRQANDIAPPNITSLDMPISQLFLLTVVLAPLAEELLFRSWLRMTKRGLIAAFVILLIIGGYWLFSSYASNSVTFVILVSVWTNWMIFELYFGLKKNWYDDRAIAKYYYPIIFYGSALIFGLVHISNYEHDGFIILLPLIITQFLTGLVLGYTRVRYGLSAAIIFHALHNGLLISFAYSAGNL